VCVGESLLNFDATRGRIASQDEFMAMSIIGSVVEVNSEDFNIACICSSVDGQLNSGDASFQVSVKDLVLEAGGNASSLDVDSAGKNGRRSPLTVNDLSECGVGHSVLAGNVLEILGSKSSLGISRISGIGSSESSGRTTSSISTNNGDGIGGGGSETREIDFGEEGGHRDCGSSCGSVGHSP